MNQLEALWNFVLDGSLKATVLIGCVLLLRPLLRRWVPAQCFHLLWLLVGVRLLLPVAPSSSASVFNLLRADKMRPQEEVSGWMVRREPVSTPLLAQAPANPVSGAASRGRVRFNFTALLPGLWIAGVVGQVLLLTFSARRLRRSLADATHVDDPQLLALARQCAGTLGLRREVELLETDALAGPAVVGLWRPRLLLPRALWPRLTEEQMHFVLLHECAHLRRLDLAAMWLLTAVRIVHWFNPMVWVAVRVARTDAELACDETVLRRITDDARGAYGETLLSLAQLVAWRQPALPAAGILESQRALRARLLSIGSFSGRAPWRAAVAVLVLFGVGLVFAADEKPTPAASEPGTSNPTKKEGADSIGGAEVTLPPRDEPARTKQIEIESRFIETTDTAILRLKSSGAGIELLRAALRGGPEDYVLTGDEAVEFSRAIEGGRGVDLFSAPKVMTKSGQRAVIEIIREFRYPIEWERHGEKQLWVPKTFETRNCGVTLEVEPLMDPTGDIVLKLVPQVVELLGFRDFESGEPFPIRFANPRGLAPRTPLSIPTTSPRMGKYGLRPVFSARKRETTVTLKPGEAVVLAALPESEDVQPFKSPAATRRLIATISARLVDAPAAPRGRSFPTVAEPIVAARVEELLHGIVRRGEPPQAGAARPAAGEIPLGIFRAGDKAGFVRSPHAPEAGLIDVRGFPPGTEIKCPYTQKILLVP